MTHLIKGAGIDAVMLTGFMEKTATDRATIIVDAPPGELGLRFVYSPFGPMVVPDYFLVDGCF